MRLTAPTTQRAVCSLLRRLFEPRLPPPLPPPPPPPRPHPHPHPHPHSSPFSAASFFHVWARVLRTSRPVYCGRVGPLLEECCSAVDSPLPTWRGRLHGLHACSMKERRPLCHRDRSRSPPPPACAGCACNLEAAAASRSRVDGVSATMFSRRRRPGTRTGRGRQHRGAALSRRCPRS